MNFGIKHKGTSLWFGGFDAQHNVLWVSEENARRMTKLIAEGQAALLVCTDPQVQRKAARVAA